MTMVMSLGRKLPSAGSLLVGILVGLVVATVCVSTIPMVLPMPE